MIVAVLYDDVESRAGSTADERGVLEAVEEVTAALRTLGHDAPRIPAGADPDGWSRRLQDSAPQVVFNLCEGLGGRSEGEVLAAEIVAGLGYPLTGSPSTTLGLARRKDRVNALLASRGLPVPEWGLWNGEDPGAFVSRWSVYPAIVKPAAEDGSVGITQDSVVGDSTALRARIEAMATMAPLLVQAFVGTREVNAAIVGGVVLPLTEILFADLPGGHHPMVDYAAKWSPGSPQDLGTRPVCPAPLPPSMASRIRLLALRAWWAIGGKGYGRVDFRVDPHDNVHILEVNPNPDLAPSAGLARGARAQGWNYPNLVERILAEATTRTEVLAR